MSVPVVVTAVSLFTVNTYLEKKKKKTEIPMLIIYLATATFPKRTHCSSRLAFNLKALIAEVKWG